MLGGGGGCCWCRDGRDGGVAGEGMMGEKRVERGGGV
jgi:hypothetical protein